MTTPSTNDNQDFEQVLADMASEDRVVADMATWLAERFNTLGVPKPANA